jgi:type VI secretion system VasD/TssJ family lipoprotein
MTRDILLGLVAIVCAACRTSGLACLDLVAAPALNLDDGQPHAAVVYLYPLASPLAFEQASSEDLLRGLRPDGALAAEPWKISILPGERRALAERFAPQTRALGVLIDVYRPHGSRSRARKLVVDGRCGVLGWGIREIAVDAADAR